jgi:D-serine deaminase-like pyridoxal phosphate-dependent protein
MTAITELETPAVTVHLDVMADNIRRVQAHLTRHGLGNRPHIKTHKIPAIGQMQMAAGAVGITCQKLGEVEVFADAKVSDDVLLTYNILGAAKTERLTALARRVRRLAVVFDNEVVARELSAAAARDHVDLEFLVECDTGFRRTGVQTPDEALALARTAMALPGLQFKGLMTFPNRDPDTREFFRQALALFRAGIAVPVVSGGGTPALATVRRRADRHGAAPASATRDGGRAVHRHVVGMRVRVRATVVSRPIADRECSTREQDAHLGPLPHEGLRPRVGTKRTWPTSPRSTRWSISAPARSARRWARW